MGHVEFLAVLASVAGIISVVLWSTRDVKASLSERMDGMDRRFDKMDELSDRLKLQLDAGAADVINRFDALHSRIEIRFDSATARGDGLHASIDRLRGEVLTHVDEGRAALNTKINEGRAEDAARLAEVAGSLGSRIDDLESAIEPR